MSSHSHSHPVSLPSIQELFPDHLLNQKSPRQQHGYRHRSSPGPAVDDRPSSHDGAHRMTYSGHIPRERRPHMVHHVEDQTVPSRSHHLYREPDHAPVSSQHRNRDVHATPSYPAPRSTHREPSYTYPPPPAPASMHGSYAPHPSRSSHSFEVLRSIPSRESLEPLAVGSRVGRPPRELGPVSSSPYYHSPASGPSQIYEDELDDSEDGSPAHSPSSLPQNSSEYEVYIPGARAPTERSSGSHRVDRPIDDGKRHVCTLCLKRFNRPSSLAIHANTHTGAKPFKCPYPGCGRLFNVNSNMRRHYRAHSSTDSPSWSPTAMSSSSSTSGTEYQFIRFPSPESHISESDRDEERRGYQHGTSSGWESASGAWQGYDVRPSRREGYSRPERERVPPT